MVDILVKNALINNKVYDVAITGNKISKIGIGLKDDATKIINADFNVVIPGYVDSHTHLDKCLLNETSNYVEGTGPEKGKLTLERKVNFTVDDITTRAESMILKAIKSGTLHLRTNVDVDASVGLKGIEALLKLKKKYQDHIKIQVVAFAQEGVFADGQTEKLLEQAIKLGADLIGGHTIAKGEGKKHIDFILDLAKRYNIQADFHLDESGNREHYLMPYLADKMVEMNLIGRVNGIHMCTLAALNSEELEQAMYAIRKSKLKLTIAPTAISTRSIAPAKKVLSNGVLVGLGSDNLRDFFNPLGSANVAHMALLLGYLQRFYQEEEVLQLFAMITTMGAELLGVPYGIKEGAVADLTILDGKSPKEVLAYQLPVKTLIRNGKLI
jgi:cytosine/adenosine deaminase-related metal-dependent hydrolase